MGGEKFCELNNMFPRDGTSELKVDEGLGGEFLVVKECKGGIAL